MSAASLQSALAAFLDGGVPGQISAWLATYLVHGVCLFLVATIAVRFIKSARGAEQLWRAALFGPLVTASLQLGAGLQPALGHWELPGRARVVAGESAPAVRIASGQHDALANREAIILTRLSELDDQLSVVTGASAAGEWRIHPAAEAKPNLQAGGDRSSMGFGGVMALAAVAAGIAALMLRALLEAIRIHRLGTKTRLMSGPVIESVRALAGRAGIQRNIRVEVTRSGSSPYATGALFPRIVLPERAVQELDSNSMHAMLAHEIGHVARFDPLWTAAARSVAALFFFQPLNWLMVRRLDESAEYCCDEFAVDVTGDEVALARCLTTVAEWIVGSSSSVRAACPMAHRNSPLASRVDRILATEGEPAGPLGPLRWMGGAAVLATALAAPGFAGTASMAEALHSPEMALTSASLVAEAPSPATPFEALELSVTQLGEEIDELILVAVEREVSESTLQRLRLMRERTRRVHAFARALRQKASHIQR